MKPTIRSYYLIDGVRVSIRIFRRRMLFGENARARFAVEETTTHEDGRIYRRTVEQ